MTCSNCPNPGPLTPVVVRREVQTDLCEFRKMPCDENWCSECLVEYADDLEDGS